MSNSPVSDGFVSFETASTINVFVDCFIDCFCSIVQNGYADVNNTKMSTLVLPIQFEQLLLGRLRERFSNTTDKLLLGRFSPQTSIYEFPWNTFHKKILNKRFWSKIFGGIFQKFQILITNLFKVITTKLFSTTRNTFERQKIKFVAFFKAAMFSRIRQLHPTKINRVIEMTHRLWAIVYESLS